MEKVCLDVADVVRDAPTILRKKIEDLREVGALMRIAGRRAAYRANHAAAMKPGVTCSRVSQHGVRI
jgi:hypothetical protein